MYGGVEQKKLPILTLEKLTLVALGAGLGLVMTVAGPQLAGEDWLSTMINAVRLVQHQKGNRDERFEPYLAQLGRARSAYQKSDVTGTYIAMNRFMEMLEKREHGVPPATADWLYDFCSVVTPAQYHDVSRHQERFIERQFREPIG